MHPFVASSHSFPLHFTSRHQQFEASTAALQHTGQLGTSLHAEMSCEQQNASFLDHSMQQPRQDRFQMYSHLEPAAALQTAAGIGQRVVSSTRPSTAVIHSGREHGHAPCHGLARQVDERPHLLRVPTDQHTFSQSARQCHSASEQSYPSPQHGDGYISFAQQHTGDDRHQQLPSNLPRQQRPHHSTRPEHAEDAHGDLQKPNVDRQVVHQDARGHAQLRQQAPAHLQPLDLHAPVERHWAGPCGSHQSCADSEAAAVDAAMRQTPDELSVLHAPPQPGNQTAVTSLTAMEAVLADYKALRTQIASAEQQLLGLQSAVMQSRHQVFSETTTWDSKTRMGQDVHAEAKLTAAIQRLEQLKHAAARQRPAVEAVAEQLRNKLLHSRD